MSDFSKVKDAVRFRTRKHGPNHGRYDIRDKRYRKLVIHNAPIMITCDENDKLQVLRNHSVEIEDDTIVNVAPAESIDTEKHDLVFDAGKRGGVIITPGLINTHAHPPMYLMRSIMTLDEGDELEETIKAMPKWESVMSDDEYATGAIGDFTEQQKNGITTTLSHYGVFQPIDFAAEISGQNVINALSAVSNTHPDNSPEMVEKLVKNSRKFKSKIAIALHYLYKANPEIMEKISRIVNEHNLIFTCHMAESEKVEENCLRTFGLRETEVLEKYDLLKNAILSHCIYVNDDEIKRIIDAGSGISHLPTSNVIHKSGRFRFWKFYEKGGFPKISLGTDSVVSKGRVDILSEAYQTRITHLYRRTVKYSSLFKMMTINGARVLGMHDRGKIIKGYKADLALWKIQDRGCIPYDENNPVSILSNFIIHGGRPVRDLVINGKFVIKDRKHQLVNESRLLRELQKCHMDLRKKVS